MPYERHETEGNPFMSERITVKDLARICGVSLGTIDRALNNRPGINEETKKRILLTAEKYNYIKNEHALTLSSGKSRIIGIIVFNLNSEYFSRLITSIEKSVRDENYTPIFMLSNINQENEMNCIQSMLALNVSGIITCSCLQDNSIYLDLRKRGIPVVAVGNRIGSDVPYVGIDDYRAMYDAAQMVLERGYRRLIYISPVLEKRFSENIGAQGERFRGFEDAVSEVSSAMPCVIGSYDNYKERIVSAVNHAVEAGEKCCILCTSDNYTAECLKLFENRIKPTGQIGLVGFDHAKTLNILYPSLPSVSYPSDEIGRAAVSRILSAEDSDVIFPHQLICEYSIC